MVDQTTTVEKPKSEKAKKAPATEPKVEEKVAEIEEQLNALEPVAKIVERKLKYQDEERVYLQHEMSFFSKIKFFRLMSGTLRLATQEDGHGVAELLGQAYSGAQQLGDNNAEIANVFLDSILRLVELAPDFLEEVYLLALNVKPEEQPWVLQSLQEIDDETGLEILDTFIAQNGKAIADFFSKRLGKLTKRVQQYIPTQEDESETTT